MALTRDFKETIRDRAQQDPEFRRELFQQAIESLFSGDVETGKEVLRNYINATIGFAKLEKKSHIPAKSLMRMFSPNGNPSASNLFAVLHQLEKHEGVTIHLIRGSEASSFDRSRQHNRSTRRNDRALVPAG